LGLGTDTDFHVGNQWSRPFHEIYEEFRVGRSPMDSKDREVWERVRRSGLPLIVARPAILPYTDMVLWVLDRIERDGRILRRDAFALISCSTSNFQRMYKLLVP